MKFMPFLLAAIYICLWADPASAAPIGALIAVVVGKVASAITAKAIFGAILKMVLSTAVTMLMRQRMKKKTSTPGITTERKRTGGVNSRSIVLGRYATAGTELAPPMSQGSTSKTPNLYLSYVVAVNSLPIEGLVAIIIDGEYVPITANTDSSTQIYGRKLMGKFEREGGRGWIREKNGTQTAADEMLMQMFASYPKRPWTSAMVGRGIAYMIPTFRWDSVITRGEPDIKYVIDGTKLYDPRLDSSRGGNGPHRWGNRNTYTFTTNPIVMVYNIMLGIDLMNGSTYGCNVDLDDLPLANWVAAMNKCDVQVSIPGNTTEARYRAGCEIMVAEDEPGDIVDMLLDTCCGAIVEIGGVWKVRVGAPELPVMYLTDRDFLVNRPQELDPFPGIKESHNTINCSYPSPEELFAAHDAPTIQIAEYLAQDDNEVVSYDLNLNACIYPYQVQRVMRALLKDDRRWRSHVGTLGPMGLPIEPLDTVAWTSERNGYDNKLFEITSLDEDIVRILTGVTLREVDPTDYDWSPSMGLPDPVSPGGWVFPAPQTVPGFQVDAYSVVDSAGRRQPVIRCSWDADAAEDATSLKIFVRRAGGTLIETDKTVTQLSTGYTNVGNVLASTAYEVSAEYTIPRRATTRTSWLPVTTGRLVIPKDDVDPDWVDEITGIAESAGIKTYAELPPSGHENQIIMLVPPGRLYRWDTTLNPPAWSQNLYGGIPPGAITMTEMAQSIQPPLVWPPSGQPNVLPTVKQSSEVLLFQGKLFRWNGSAYTAQITGADIPTGAITEVKIADNAISAGKIAANAVTANAIDAGAVTANSLAANSVTAGSIAAGAVGADQIAAQAIIASKLMVADFSNLVVNNWLGGDFDGWATNGDVTIENRTDSVFVSGGIAGYMAVYRGGEGWIRSPISTVSKGDEYYVEVYVRRSPATVPDGTVSVGVRWTLNDGTAVYTNVGVVSTFPVVLVSGIVVAPDNAVDASIWIRPNLGGTVGMVLLARPVIRRANSGELYVDGSITANAMSANSVTANAIAAGAVVASKIAAGAIGAGHLVVGEAVITTAAQIKEATVGRLHIGNNEIYLPYNWSRSDYQITTAYNISNKVTFVNHNITQFEGGAFNVSFNADMDALSVDDGCAGFDLLIDDVVVRTSRYGANAGGGGGGKVNIIMPIVMSASAFGSSSVNIKVRGWSFKWDSPNTAHQPIWVRNITLTVSGGRR